ncbi:MAG: replication protein [Candidatus Methylumidiphilus sp.]
MQKPTRADKTPPANSLVPAKDYALTPDANLPPGIFTTAQLDLFQTFLCNAGEKDKLSNAIDLWDSVPRYSISQLEMNKRRTADGFLGLLEIKFKYRGLDFRAVIQPARIRESDGQTIDYYPSANEELVEDILRKIAAERLSGFHDTENAKIGVYFSLYQIQTELKKRGHTRSISEIKRSLEIMAKSSIEIKSLDGKGNEGTRVSNYLPDMVAVSREDLKADPYSQWMVAFHPLVTKSIIETTYRQFDLDKLMSMSTQLGRWVHRQLVIKYTFAGLMTPFEIRYSTIKRDSFMINYGRERAGIAALDQVMSELKEQKIIMDFQRQVINGARRKILDVVYTLTPSMEFIKEAKAANKRKAMAQEKLSADTAKAKLDRP